MLWLNPHPQIVDPKAFGGFFRPHSIGESLLRQQKPLRLHNSLSAYLFKSHKRDIQKLANLLSLQMSFLLTEMNSHNDGDLESGTSGIFICTSQQSSHGSSEQFLPR